MKRIVLAGILLAGAAALVMAQGARERRGERFGPRAPGEVVNVTGTLSVDNGTIAMRQGGTTYYLRRLERFVGFIDGLKEGAEVTINGTAFGGKKDETRKLLLPATMTLNGKTYDLEPRRAGWGEGGWGEGGRGRHCGRSRS
jgi:hypothetical protein